MKVKNSFVLIIVASLAFTSWGADLGQLKGKPKVFQKFSSGLYVNAEFNRSKYNQPNFPLAYTTKNPVQPALGINLSKGINSFLIAHVSGGLSKARYGFEFEEVNGEPRLQSIEIGFIQSKVGLDYVINKASHNHFFMVGASVQGLYRLYSQKVYVNKEIENTNYPLVSVFPMASVSFRSYFNQGSYVQPSLNFRFQPLRPTIYDRTLNQVSIGFIVGGDITKLAKREKKPVEDTKTLKRKL